jgi:hypothetical protein
MNKENTEQLYKDFPELYRGKDKSPQATSMCFGFECGDGWFQIIYRLSKQITDHCKNKSRVEIPEVMQVKEKFGTLRFYIDYGDNYIYDVIEDAELISSVICDICGKWGSPTKIHGWQLTRCEEHAREIS